MVNMVILGEEKWSIWSFQERIYGQYGHFRRGNIGNVFILGEEISSIWSF